MHSSIFITFFGLPQGDKKHVYISKSWVVCFLIRIQVHNELAANNDFRLYEGISVTRQQCMECNKENRWILEIPSVAFAQRPILRKLLATYVAFVHCLLIFHVWHCRFLFPCLTRSFFLYLSFSISLSFSLSLSLSVCLCHSPYLSLSFCLCISHTLTLFV